MNRLIAALLAGIASISLAAQVASAERTCVDLGLVAWITDNGARVGVAEDGALYARRGSSWVQLSPETLRRSRLGDRERAAEAEQFLKFAFARRGTRLNPARLRLMAQGVLKAHHSHGKGIGGLGPAELLRVIRELRKAGIQDPEIRRQLIEGGFAGEGPALSRKRMSRVIADLRSARKELETLRQQSRDIENDFSVNPRLKSVLAQQIAELEPYLARLEETVRARKHPTLNDVIKATEEAVARGERPATSSEKPSEPTPKERQENRYFVRELLNMPVPGSTVYLARKDGGYLQGRFLREEPLNPGADSSNPGKIEVEYHWFADGKINRKTTWFEEADLVPREKVPEASNWVFEDQKQNAPRLLEQVIAGERELLDANAKEEPTQAEIESTAKAFVDAIVDWVLYKKQWARAQQLEAELKRYSANAGPEYSFDHVLELQGKIFAIRRTLEPLSPQEQRLIEAFIQDVKKKVEFDSLHSPDEDFSFGKGQIALMEELDVLRKQQKAVHTNEDTALWAAYDRAKETPRLLRKQRFDDASKALAILNDHKHFLKLSVPSDSDVREAFPGVDNATIKKMNEAIQTDPVYNRLYGNEREVLKHLMSSTVKRPMSSPQAWEAAIQNPTRRFYLERYRLMLRMIRFHD